MKNLGLILLIDDNPDDFEATSRALKKNHLSNPIHWCASGQDAKDFLFRLGPYENQITATPVIIFLDLNMPGLEGRKLLREIKANEALSQIPVVVLTTSDDMNDVSACYRLGASSYIQKPLNFDSLTRAIKTVKDYWFNVAILPSENL
jgi:CheY-like chemotaxis protein